MKDYFKVTTKTIIEDQTPITHIPSMEAIYFSYTGAKPASGKLCQAYNIGTGIHRIIEFKKVD